jgi:23S rRNA (cytosine1962-C5)-methyltransferase
VQLRSASFHPFIFERMVRTADPAARPGDVVNVYDKMGRFFGRGMYSPKSQIVLRMLSHDDRPIDDAFWQSAIAQAVAFRRTLNLDAVTDAYRLVHAEGDGLSGLILERYADCLVMEVFSLGIYQRAGMLMRAAAEAMGPPTSLDRPDKASPTWRTIIRADEAIERIEGFRVRADEREMSGKVTIREHGIRYRVDASGGQKTGFFCDQRDNRLRLATLCKDATVLDGCCYTGGFGLAAKVLGGAKEVTSVDIDEDALAIAKENVNLNNTRLSLVHSDMFNYLRQMLAINRQFDVVILDPPKLAASRTLVDDALRKYHDLNSLGMKMVRPGGILLTCSCSGLISRDMFMQTVQRARPMGRNLQLFEYTGAAADHPVMMSCPESAYLKAAWFRVL